MINKPFTGKENKFVLSKKNMTLMAASGALVISMAAPVALAAPGDGEFEALAELVPVDPDAAVPADVLTLNDFEIGDAAITGTAQPGATVNITFPSLTVSLAIADAEGNFSVAVPETEELALEDELLFSVTDAAGSVLLALNFQLVEDAIEPIPDVPLNAVVLDAFEQGDLAVTGTTDAGATVSVIFPNGEAVEAVAGADGLFSIAVPAELELEVGAQLAITLFNAEGSPLSTVLFSVVEPIGEEPEPTPEPDPDDIVQVRVIAEYVDADGNEIAPAVAILGAVGDAYSTEQLEIEGYEFVETEGAASGEMARETATVTYVYQAVEQEEPEEPVDETPPAQPTVNDFAAGDTAIAGIAEAGALVTVTFADGTTATATAGEDGSYSIALPEGLELVDGEEFTVTATDEAGNVSEAQTGVIVVEDDDEEPVDETAPDAPVVNPITEGDDLITGTAEAGSMVSILFEDGTLSNVSADADGNFSLGVPGVPIVAGDVITFTALDDAANESEPTVVVVGEPEEEPDTTAPDAPLVNDFTEGDAVITGSAEAGSNVVVNFGDGEIASVSGTADADGNFSIDVPAEVELVADSTFSVIAADEAGNISEETIVTVLGADEEDVTAPDAPVVSDFVAGDDTVTGTAEAGSTVTATFSDTESSSATVDEDGNFSIDVPVELELVAGNTFMVNAIDEAGNMSAETIVTVLDADEIAPDAPVVNEFVFGDTGITGQAEPGSNVTVTFADGTTASGTTDEAGDFSIVIPAEVDVAIGDILSLTAEDEAGNVSDATEIEVLETATEPDTEAPGAPTVYPYFIGDGAVMGEAEEGSTVTVLFPDGTTATDVAEAPADSVFDELEVPVVSIIVDENGDPITDVEVEADEEAVSVAAVESDETVQVAAIGDEGIFSVDVPEDMVLAAGDELRITATDEAGNVSEEVVVVVAEQPEIDEPIVEKPDPEAPVDEDNEDAPDAPTVQDYYLGDAAVTGVAEAGSTVAVLFPLKKYDRDAQLVVDADAPASVVVTYVDAEGNELAPAVTLYGDVNEFYMAPYAPVEGHFLQSVDGRTVGGMASGVTNIEYVYTTDLDAADMELHERESYVAPEGEIDYVYSFDEAAAENGLFSVGVDPAYGLEIGDELVVTATDAEGNVSNETVITVKDPADKPADTPDADDDNGGVLTPKPDGSAGGGTATPGDGSDITKEGLESLPQAGAETNAWAMGLGALMSGIAGAALFMRRKVTGLFTN